MKSGVYPTIMEGVLLARIELGHISCRNITKEYRGFLRTIVSTQVEPLPQAFSLGARSIT